MNPELPKSLTASASEALKLKGQLESISVDALKLAELLGSASNMLTEAHMSVLANAPVIIDMPIPPAKPVVTPKPVQPVLPPKPSPRAEMSEPPIHTPETWVHKDSEKK